MIERNVIFFHRYSVFALGSRLYIDFCAFGHYVDDHLRELGAQTILPMGEGDELSGQDESFRGWAKDVFKVTVLNSVNTHMDTSAQVLPIKHKAQHDSNKRSFASLENTFKQTIVFHKEPVLNRLWLTCRRFRIEDCWIFTLSRYTIINEARVKRFHEKHPP